MPIANRRHYSVFIVAASATTFCLLLLFSAPTPAAADKGWLESFPTGDAKHDLAGAPKPKSMVEFIEQCEALAALADAVGDVAEEIRRLSDGDENVDVTKQLRKRIYDAYEMRMMGTHPKEALMKLAKMSSLLRIYLSEVPTIHISSGHNGEELLAKAAPAEKPNDADALRAPLNAWKKKLEETDPNTLRISLTFSYANSDRKQVLERAKKTLGHLNERFEKIGQW